MKKGLLITGVIIFALVAFLAAIPFLFKDKIINAIKAEANKSLNATLTFNNDIDISIFKSFPNLSVGINQLNIVGSNNFIADTLFFAKNTSITLDIMSVINGDQIGISKVLLVEPIVNAIIAKDGSVNWDIVKPDIDTVAAQPSEESKFNIKLKQLTVQNGTLTYNDFEGNISTQLKQIDYTLEGDFTQDLFTLNNKMNIGSFSVKMDGITYLNNVNATATALIDADMPNMHFTFKDNTFTLNNLSFGFAGLVSMPTDDIVMDITYSAKQNEFKNFLTLIPAIYASDLSKLQSKGKMDFNGFAKGIYNQKSMPAFGLNLAVNNGWFKYTDMPTPLENVEVKLAINNPDGNLNHTTIDLSKCDFVLQQNPFKMHLKVTNPMADPNIDFAANGKINLTHIASLIALENGTELSGIITSNVLVKGNVSAIEKQQFDNFAASGNLHIDKLVYNSKELPKPFKMDVADMDISAKQFNLNAFKASIGQSDFNLTGRISNFIPYYFNDGILQAQFNLVSNQINANEFLAQEDATAQQAATDTAALSVFEVPKNMDVVFNSNIGKLHYTNMEIDNFVGAVTVKNQQINFNNIGLTTLGSNIKMNGFYSTVNLAEPKVEMDFSIANLDVQKAFKTFNTIQKLAPAAEHVFGMFSTNFSMQTTLTQNMQPVFANLFAKGLLTVPQAEVKNVKSIDKIADALQKPEYKTAGLYNSKIDFKVENGRIYTKPFDIKLAGKVLNLTGSTGLDQTIDYVGNMTIPRSEFGAGNTAVNEALVALNNKLGSNITVNDMIPVGITIGGTFTNPKIGTNIGNLIKGEVGSLTNQLKDEAAKKKAELEAKAKAEADRLKKEGEDKVNQAKAEAEAKAKAEAERLRKEAEEKANAEKERLKKKAEEEAKKRLKGLF